jgi:FkbM family methyltransferase
MISVKDKVRRNVLVSSDHGLMIVNRFDCNGEQVGHGQWLLDHGNTSTVEAQTAYDCLRDRTEPVIFDIGANIGTFTTWMTTAFPRGKIYSFEPQRLVFQMLCGNLAINNFDNCYAYNLGLGSANTRIEIQEPDYYKREDFGIFSLVEDKVHNKSGISTVVEIMTLDTFVQLNRITRVDYIKIDVEGMDIDVLKGAEKTLAAYSPCIFIEHSDNRRSILDEIVAFLGQDCYNFKVIGNNVLAVPS